MDLNDIVVFAKVAETKSFTAAADALGLPKSTVSRKLAQLEDRLGVRLVQRTTRKIALTEIGEAYYARCMRIVGDVAEADQLVMDMQSSPRGRLRVTSSIALATQYLGGVIATFLGAHPEITFELDATDRVVDLIEEGFDIALRFGPLPESSLIARRLGFIQLVLCAAPTFLAHGVPATIDELDAYEHLLFMPSPRTLSWTLFGGTTEQTYEFGRPARFASNNSGAVRNVALAGHGIALLSDLTIADDLARGTLVQVLPEWQTRPTELHAVYPARQNVPPRLSLFLDHIAGALSPPPWQR